LLGLWPRSSSFGITSTFIFCWHLKCYHLLLASLVPSSSFGLANAITAYFFVGFTVAPLWAVVSFILPHCCTFLDNIIFYSAPLAMLSSVFPHGCAHLAILFSNQPNGCAILAKYFSIRPHGFASPGKILLLITYQGFLRAAFLKTALAPIPTWFFKGSFHWCWCCFSCKFYDSWNGLSSSCLQKSSDHYHLFYGKHLV
jgi:hypothetical protein